MDDIVNMVPSVVNSVADKIEDKIHSNVIYNLGKKMQKSGEPPKEVTSKERLIWSALGGLSGLAVSGGIAKALRLNKALTIPLITASIVGGIGTGFSSPDFHNVLKERKSDIISDEEAKKKVLKLKRTGDHAFKRFYEVGEVFAGTSDGSSDYNMNKEAGIFGSAFRYGAKGVMGGASLFAGGLTGGLIGRNVKNKFGRKALSFASKGAVVGGAGYAGYKGIKKLTGPTSGSNYTTFLRNQLLKGNIRSHELPQQDLISVRKLGMK